MTATDLFGLIGTTSTDANFAERISALGLDPRALQVDEYLASVSDKRGGLEIALKDQAMFSPVGRRAMSGIWVIEGIHLHAAGHDGFGGYTGTLPFGVVFGDERAVVLRKLGKPKASGGGNKGPGGIVWPFWDSYPMGGSVDARFQYDSAGRLVLITGFRGLK